VGNDRDKPIFAPSQSMGLNGVYWAKIVDIDRKPTAANGHRSAGMDKRQLLYLMARTRTPFSGVALLCRAATTTGRSDTDLGAFYRRLSSRISKQNAATTCEKRQCCSKPPA
jgi:hypothetical protein